jgi:EpsI family protein
MAAGVAYIHVHHPAWNLPTALPQPLSRFPAEVAEWRCTETDRTDEAYIDPNADEAISRRCEGSENNVRMWLSIGYIARQQPGKRLHSPRFHYPNNDPQWRYVSSQPVDIPIDAAAVASIRVNQTMLQYGTGEPTVILYWYQVGKRSFSNEYRYRWALFKGSVIHGRTDAAVIRIAAQVRRQQTVDVVLSSEQRLARALYPAIMKALP